MPTDLVTNSRAGKLLTLSPSGVSRLLSGGRAPSWETMARIELVLDWSVGDQARQVQKGTFLAVLRYRLNDRIKHDLEAATAADVS